MPHGNKKLSGAKLARKKVAAYHHGDLRRVLTAAALELIIERGVEAFSLRELARRAGVSTAAPYWHFPDRNALLGAVAAECAERWLRSMHAAVEACGADEPLPRLQATGIAHVRFAVENPAHFRVMEMPWIREQMPASVRQQIDDFYEAEGARLAEAQRQGTLAPIPMDLLKLTTRSLVNGLAHLMISDDPQVKGLTAAQARDVAEQVTRVLGVGLLPR